jgi:TorA maturation chaperone TorD
MSLTANQPSPAIDTEEQARANFYALLARLFYAPPEEAFLHRIASSDDDAQANDGSDESLAAGSLDSAWFDLVSAAASADQVKVADEYNGLFVGSGRAEISLYVGAYTARSSVDSNLVALREFLGSYGLARQSSVNEPEDHVAMLFEVMRHLISEEQAPIDEQRLFFDRFVRQGAVSLCDAISNHDRADFFRNVAVFAKRFLLVEHDAFEM